MDPAALVRHLLDTHHALLHRELPRLDALIVGGDAEPALQEAWAELSDLLAFHLMKEERVLFPAILGLVGGGPSSPCGVEGPIAQMRWEHTRIEALDGTLRPLLGGAGAVADQVRVILDDLVVHAHVEDDELFPAALALEAARSSGS